MTRRNFRKMLNEAFRHWEEINKRKSVKKTLYKLRLLDFNKVVLDEGDFVTALYKNNKLNPLFWLIVIFSFLASIFVGGINNFIRNIKTDFNRIDSLRIPKTIYLKYN